MQSKGFIRVIAILLVLVCAFYLSFSFVTRHFEGKAAEYAQAQSHSNDPSKEGYKTFYNAYIDSIAKEKVYLGYYTFQQAREMEVGLGLDLKGGMNVTLQISVPDILRALSNENPDPKFNRAIALTDSLHRADKDFVGAFYAEYKKLAPEGSLAQIFRGLDKVKPGASNEEIETVLRGEVASMVDNSYNVLRTRIDRFGVVAPNIQKLERDGQILLELPGVKEPERVRKLLKGTANLEFYETYTMKDLGSALQALSQATAGTAPAEAVDSIATDSTKLATDSLALAQVDSAKTVTPAKAKKATPAKVTPGRDLLTLLNGGGNGGPVIGTTAVLDTAAVNKILSSPEAKRLLPTNLKARWTVKAIDEKGKFFQLVALKSNSGKPVLNGDVVIDASSDYDNMQGNIVSMTMNDEGARSWARVTQNNLNKSIAIVLDDQVYSFPNVNSVIEGGRSQITGNFTVEEAKDLANVLKSGKMVANVNIVSESVIGPSLGQQAITNGLMSFVLALVLLMIFMIVIYGTWPGLIANFGLVCNLFFTLGILASIQAVLTLSGIAGIVLALGMAVDANVLIFERSKEELRAGKGIKAAIADGYKHAFSAIFDSNLTSIITGVILLIYGTGPIKGFATTLIISIVCSFFTAVFITRLIFEGVLDKGGFKNLTFTTKLTKDLGTNTHINFIGKRKIGYIVMLVMIIIASISFGVRKLSPGIDFSGGRNYIVQFTHPVKTHELQAQLANSFQGASLSVITIDNDTKVRISTNYKIASNNENIDIEIMGILYQGLKSELGDMTYDDFSVSNEDIGVISTEKVGPSIAADITRGAIWAVVLSLIAMALYILIRFRDISFSAGALAAVAFTAFIIIGFYSLFYGRLPFSMEIDQSFIAAILTVIGYQVNDTVVVFDRVRETRTLYPKQDPLETFNNSLNSTLTRTIMTSFSTFLVLLCIFILGGETIRSLTFAMLLGVVIGTLATLFIAAPTAYLIQVAEAKKKARKAKAQQ
ncbi:MAG: protein translocase subunit SecDF [Muribaculaceae bacterium]